MNRRKQQLEEIEGAADKAHEAPDLRPGGGDDADAKGRLYLPPDCPVTPLGKDGLTLYLLDASKQIIGLRPRDLGKGELLLLFGDEEYLVDHWPQWSQPKKDKPSEVIGFHQGDTQAAIVLACRAKGIFNKLNKVRGRGAHANDDGSMVLHLGATVLLVNPLDKKGKVTLKIEPHRPGKVGPYYYEAADPLPPPDELGATIAESQLLLELLGKWFWKRQTIAPLLVLGEIACMMICGFLEHRPHLWLTGPTAAGKSELQRLFKILLDTWSLQSNDATEAAIRQILGQDTLAVLIDEAEADNDAEKQKRILNLARLAATGGQVIKGGADHKGQTFVAQSCFLFSSIIHGQLQPQDRNRLVILEMQQVPPEAPDLKIDVKMWKATGRRIHRRILDQWSRWGRTYADYCREIHLMGFTGREQKLYGTLLAAADLLLYDVAPSQECEANDGDGFGREKRLVQQVLPLLKQARTEGQDDRARCVAHLTSCLLPAISGQPQETVGQWIVRAYYPDDTGDVCEWARKKLKMHGMRLVKLKSTASGNLGYEEPGAGGEEVFVAVAAATNAGLAPLFRGSEWPGGSWMQSLGRLEGAERLKVHFTGKPDNAVVVPIQQLVDLVP